MFFLGGGGGALEGDGLAEDGDVLHLLQLGTHEFGGLWCPAAVLDDGDGAALPCVGLEVGEEVFDGCEEAVVVGAGGEDDMAGAEAFGYQFADMCVAGVVGLDATHATLAEQCAKSQGGGFGVAIDAAIDDDHGLLFWLILAPHVVLADKPTEIFSPHGSVQRAYHLDVECGGFLEHILHLHAVFANDVDVVAAGVADPLMLEVHLVGEEVAAEGTEGAEGVGGEEDLRGAVVGHHHLGPVHHGSHGEDQRVGAGADGVALFDGHQLCGLGAEELLHHLCCFGSGDHRSLGVAQQEVHQRGGMVGLHVVDDDVVEWAAREGCGDVFKELRCDRGIGGVEEDGFVIQQYIAVVADAAGDGVGVFEQGESAVAGADVEEVVVDMGYVVHGFGVKGLKGLKSFNGPAEKTRGLRYDNENESEKLFDATFFERETGSGGFSPFLFVKKVLNILCCLHRWDYFPKFAIVFLCAE